MYGNVGPKAHGGTNAVMDINCTLPQWRTLRVVARAAVPHLPHPHSPFRFGRVFDQFSLHKPENCFNDACGGLAQVEMAKCMPNCCLQTTNIIFCIFVLARLLLVQGSRWNWPPWGRLRLAPKKTGIFPPWYFSAMSSFVRWHDLMA